MSSTGEELALPECASICLRYAAYEIYNLNNRMKVPLSVLDQDKALIRNAYTMILRAGYPIVADACNFWMRGGLVGMNAQSAYPIPYPPLYTASHRSLEMQCRSTKLLMDIMLAGINQDIETMYRCLEESDPALVEYTVIKVPYCAAALIIGSAGRKVERLISFNEDQLLFVGEPFFVKYANA